MEEYRFLYYSHTDIYDGGNRAMMTTGEYLPHTLGRRCLSQELDEFSLQFHYHEQLEMHYITDGSISHKIADSEYTSKKGELVIINSAEKHSTSSGEGEYFMMIINSKIFKDFGMDISEIVLQHTIYDKYVIELMDIITEEDKTKGSLYRENLKSALNMLLIYLIRNYSALSSSAIRFSPKFNLALNIKKYLSSNYKNKITLKEMSQELSFNKYYLGHAFKSSFGITLWQYLTMIRITNASNELIFTEKNIKDIAIDSGFDNVSYFCNIYKTNTGFSPSEYRDKYRERLKKDPMNIL